MDCGGLSDLVYIYYRYCIYFIITGNSEMIVEFAILPDLFDIKRENQEKDLWEFVSNVSPK